MPSVATSVADFLASLPPARATELRRVRTVIRKHLPAGYVEAMRGQVVTYEVPLARYPDTYNGHPLWLAALAAPKSYLTLHLMPVYGSPVLLDRLKGGFGAADLPLRMGKACINFTSADELPLDAIGEIVGALTVDQWVAIAEGVRRSRPRTRSRG